MKETRKNAKKRIISLALVLAMLILSLAGCNDSKSEGDGTESQWESYAQDSGEASGTESGSEEWDTSTDSGTESESAESQSGSGNDGGNTGGGNTSGGNTSGGNTSGGNTSGGNTSGGSTSGGNTSGGSTSGGSTGGGSTSGGNTGGGSTSGGSTSGGNTSGGNEGATTPPQPEVYTQGLEYTLLEDGSGYAVSGIGTATDKDIVIPSVYNGKPVTNIRELAFFADDSIASITIPSSITSISEGAIYFCFGLSDINVLPGNQKYCSVDGVLFNKDISQIILYPSAKKSTTYKIPNGVKNISGETFSGCSALTKVDIPNSVAIIGRYPFSNCKRLTAINVSSGNQKFCSVDGVLFNKNMSQIIRYPCAKKGTTYKIPNGVTNILEGTFSFCTALEKVDIPSGVTDIGRTAFNDCISLVSIDIPSGVTSIGERAFDGCSSLTLINIPSSITNMNSYMFSDCKSLTDVNVSPDNQKYCSVDGVLFNKDMSQIILYPSAKKDKTYKIPSGVTSIGESAFHSCTSLDSINIPSGVTTIGAYAFSNCGSLDTVYIPSGVTSIGKMAFFYTLSLDSVNYSGTKAQWYAIDKQKGWNDHALFDVVCTDGTIPASEA